MVVCIDDVTEDLNRQCAYMFAFSAGHNILGFGEGINTNEEIVNAGKDICSSLPMTQLKHYHLSGKEEDIPPINTPDYIIAQLRLYHERQYSQSGNYALNEIRNELFPAIKDTEIDVIYKDENKEDTSLIKYITKGQDEKGKKHILLVGEGGMGKTVSLLQTCEYLLANRINAIYIPLNKIDRNTTLDKYLERIVCAGNQVIWRDLRMIMSVPTTDVPNVVLLLDGINEIPVGYIKSFIKDTVKGYIDAYQGIQLVMTSRWFDSQTMTSLQDKLQLLEMQSLDKDTIENYLCTTGVPMPEEMVFSILSTPLLLTLYADVEKHRKKYQQIEGIKLEEKPDTAGKILGNFFRLSYFEPLKRLILM